MVGRVIRQYLPPYHLVLEEPVREERLHKKAGQVFRLVRLLPIGFAQVLSDVEQFEVWEGGARVWTCGHVLDELFEKVFEQH